MAGGSRILNYVIVIFQLLAIVGGEEPHCSKYDFEEKILEKMIRMEFEMERMKLEVRDSLEIMKNINTQMERRGKYLDELLAELNVSKKTMMQEVQAEILAAKERTRSPTVVFKARSNGQMDIQYGRTLVYPTVIVNEGSGYDAGSGIFTAPVNGTYSFSTTYCLHSAKSIIAAIVVNGTRYSVAIFGDYSWSTCYSTDAVAVVKSGQKVWVQVLYEGSTGTGVLYHDEMLRWSTFSGVLVNS